MTIWSAAYYTYCFANLGFLIALIVSVHRPMWLAYCGQTAIAMLYVAALDGDIGWLGLGQETLVLLSGATLLVYSFTLVAGVMQPHALTERFRKPLHAMASISAVVPFSATFLAFDTTHNLLLMLLAMAFVAQALPPLTWGFLPAPLRPKAMPIIQAIIVATIVAAIGLSIFTQLSDGQWLIARRCALVVTVTSGVITMMYMTYIIERTRASTARRAVAAAQREAAISKSLLAAERSHNRAQKLASLQTERLSTVSHDLRQPLGSLRVMVEGLQSAEESQHAREALDYLDDLAKSFIKRQQPIAESNDSEAEIVPVATLLTTLERMFKNEAIEQGIQIRVVSSRLKAKAAPLPLMRVLANLVSNALKHADCQTVLLGARRRGAAVCVEVLDNGRGVEGDLFANGDIGTSGAGTSRSKNGKGNGLGLRIVTSLCKEHGFLISADSDVGRGSHIRVQVPRA